MQLPLVAMVLREASALIRISSIYIYTSTKKTFKNEQRNRDDTAKKKS